MTRSNNLGFYLLLGSIVIGAILASTFIQFSTNTSLLFSDSTHTFIRVTPTANGLAKISIRKPVNIKKSKPSYPPVGQLTDGLG
jgi:hypothetical protein